MNHLPFANIVVPRPLRSLFTYAVPEGMDEMAMPGFRVVVPFGKGTVVGVVAERVAESGVETRPITLAVDDAPVVPADVLALALWTARHYFAGPGEVIGALLPKGDVIIDTIVTLIPDADPPGGRAAKLRPLYEAVVKQGGQRRLDQLAAELSLTPTEVGKLLTGEGGKRLFTRRQEARAVAHRTKAREAPPIPAADLPTPTGEQQVAIDQIAEDIDAQRFKATLLFGVTGSGKTEVYAHLIRRVLLAGKAALALAPEIALAEALAARLKKRLGVEPVIIHSDMTPKERGRRWQEALVGGGKLIVGARSAVFAPAPDLGLVIVDEEHDAAYKQENAPRYQGRDVAVMRASLAHAPVVLGSATPSMESYHHALGGRYRLATLTKRIDERPLPKVTLVRPENHGVIDPKLDAAIRARLAAGEQTLLFINRRGAFRYLLCGPCGHVFECRNCSISLVLHAKEAMMRCHTCGYEETAPQSCPTCGERRFVTGGVGSERIEEELAEIYPDARIMRMDRDTTSRRGSATDILAAVERREVDILVGTQMITKGHDLPGVTLVGAVAADDSLCIPDFRAAERTFQLVTQAAGRAGRGKTPGAVIVQSIREGGHALAAACAHDFAAFYAIEAPLREMVGYPPFVRLAMLRIEASSERVGREFVKRIERTVLKAERDGVVALGPEEAVTFKIRNRYHWRIMLKAPAHGPLARAVQFLLDEGERAAGDLRGTVRVAVDMDPTTTL